MERDELLIRLRERIVAYAASQYSKEIAEDLAQEVFVVLQEKYDQVQELHDLVPLSLQILRFKMLDYRRKTFRRGESRQVPVEDLPLQSSTLHPDTLLERKQMANRILAAIQQLSPRCRLLFRMKLEGKTFSQILERLGVRSINTVYTWDFRCRKELLELLGGSWENPTEEPAADAPNPVSDRNTADQEPG